MEDGRRYYQNDSTVPGQPSGRNSPLQDTSFNTAGTPGRCRTPSPYDNHSLRGQAVQRGDSSDNPPYEDGRLPMRQGIPGSNNNPLYRNDPHSRAGDPNCMADFLQSNISRNKAMHSGSCCGGPPNARYDPYFRHRPLRPDLLGPPPTGDPYSSWNRVPRELRFAPDHPSHGHGASVQGQGVMPHAGHGHCIVPAHTGLSSKQTGQPAPRYVGPPPSRSRSPDQDVNALSANVRELVAAVRSDQQLLKAEVRRAHGREPRIPGDIDRFFAPRKGDIIVHASKTVDDKLVEYFDHNRMMHHLRPGDKLVRVKYDNYKIPDHLMITSKLYIYLPSWIYMGKAVQTIKTA